jgi:hypothetical protein
VAQRGSEDEEMADEMVDMEKEEAAEEARDVVMTETETATTTATETETEAGALATNDYSHPAQLRKMIRVDHCGTGEGSQTQGRRSASAKNISVRAECLCQSGRTPSEPSETPRWRITPHPGSLPRIALHIAL